MPSQKRYAAQYKQLSALAAHQPREIRERRTAAEEAYGAVRARLGAAGTYDVPGSTAGGGGGGAAPTEETPGIIKSKSLTTSEIGMGIDARYSGWGEQKGFEITKVDKNALLGQLEGSAEFRIASRLTAEAEQLVAREGPLWNEMIKNTQLPIIEGLGAASRENAEAIRKAVQKGGSARREAMSAMVKMQEQSKINSMRVKQISESRVALDKWARENARTQLEFNENWASNVAGVRESYNSAMDRASELMLNSALPVMMEATANAIQYREAAHAKQRAKVNNWIQGAIGVASIAAGGLGMMAATGVGMGALGAMGKIGQVAAGIGKAVAGPVDQYGNRDPSTAGGLISRGLGTLGIGGGGMERG